MAVVTARMLYSVAYEACLSAGMDRDLFEMFVERKLIKGEKWYVLRLLYLDNPQARSCRETKVFYKKAKLGAADRKYVLKKFSWLVEQKARWLKEGKRVRRQMFFDALWYTTAWELNNNPFVARWAIVDQANKNRTVVVHWSTRQEPHLRTDEFLLRYKDFSKDSMAVYDALLSGLKFVSMQIAAYVCATGSTPLRRHQRQ